MMGAYWAVVMFFQAVSAIACIVWLGLPDQPKDWPSAEVVAAMVALGLATVAIFPVLRLYLATRVEVDDEVKQLWDRRNEPAPTVESEEVPPISNTD